MRRQLPEEGTKKFASQIEGIAAILERFFGNEEGFDPMSEAYRVHATYSYVISDAWTRTEAQKALEALEKSLAKLVKAYSSLPPSLRIGFELDATHVDWLAQQEALK